MYGTTQTNQQTKPAKADGLPKSKHFKTSPKNHFLFWPFYFLKNNMAKIKTIFSSKTTDCFTHPSVWICNVLRKKNQRTKDIAK
jgi:hypothetical protein